MSRRQAEVRFYVDADILGTAHVLEALRGDVTFPGDPGRTIHKRDRPPCPITTPGTDDEDWIPIVAAHGWLIITRDANIHGNLRELTAVRDHDAKMVNLTGPDAASKWSQLMVVFKHWDRIEAARNEPGPFIYQASKSSFRPLDLDATIRRLRGQR